MPFAKAENEMEKKKTGSFSRFSVVFLALLVFLAVAIGLYMGEYAKFNPINGTFQNYNPVRRLLDGQVPYKDFQDYLGFGHLYLGTAATLLAGGTYRGSLIAFTVLTFLSTSAVFIVLGRSVAGKKHMVFFTALCVMVFLAWQMIDKKWPVFPGNAPSAFSVGNSARMIRASVLPLTAMFLLAVKDGSGIRGIAACALISAAAFLWCNDYGISCWICIALMFFIVLLASGTGFVRAVLLSALELLLSLFFIFALVELFTLGHFAEWFKSTFGTGGYQSWYYNSLKSHYLYDLDFSAAVIIQALLCVYYLIRLIMKRGSRSSVIRYGIPAYFNMVCFCAANEYKLLSGGYLWEACEIVMGATLIAEVFSFVISRCDFERAFFKKAFVAVEVMLATGVALAAVAFVFMSSGEKQGTYVPQLGGYNAELGDDLLETSDFIDGRSFFATYASAQEVVEDKFQPSGTDYIIHVLGDSTREEYLESFVKGDHELAVTINEEYSFYEYWVQRANWFFYRELYGRWHPVYSNDYETYWETNEYPEENALTGNIAVEIADLGPAVKKLVIRTDKNVNGIADVFVDWSVKKNGSALLFHPMLYVENTGAVFACYPGSGAFAGYFDTNWLRAENSEFVPVTVSDGYGEAVLTSYPEKDTVLEIRKAACGRILPVQFDYVHISSAEISADGDITLSVVNTLRNEKIAEETKQIELSGERFEVIDVKKDSMLRITVGSQDIAKISELLKEMNMARCYKGAE